MQSWFRRIMVRRMPKKPLDPRSVRTFLDSIFAEHLHAKRVGSLTDATLGVLHAASLSVHAIGLGLAAAKGLDSKHTIKQVDRLMSNVGVDPWGTLAWWVPFVIGARPEVVIALDWTDFDKDDQTTIAAYLITTHGRATPLAWKTVVKSELRDERNAHEDQLLTFLHAVIPHGVKVTVLADRGFADQKLYQMLNEFGFGYVIRFRQIIHVTDAKGKTQTGAEWVPSNGRPLLLKDAAVTHDQFRVGAVVCVKARGMKDAWCLAVSDGTLAASYVVKLYGRRFTIEEGFRDTKDIRFGMGLSSTRVSIPARRDRLLLVSALAVALLTLLGAAGESLGMDRHMKANTVKRRTHSLYRQGLHYYDCIPMMPDERLKPLVNRFAELVAEQPVFREVFGLI